MNTRSAAPQAPAQSTGSTTPEAREVKGESVRLGGEAFYRIRNFDLMDPFFMTIVSDSDHWLFVSSNGCLTAGRRNSQHALFPYYTEDKIQDMAEVTGPKTIVRAQHEGATAIWEPFSDRYRGIHRLERNLYKSECGNQVVFEEINRDLGLAFAYSWKFSDRFGFVRESRLENIGSSVVKAELIDGVQNLLPSGVHPDFQLFFSGLGDAYKKNELEAGSNLGIFSFSSVPGDKAEPMESLRANTCFVLGLERPTILLSSRQLNAFRSGQRPKAEIDVRGQRGAYFVHTSFTLEPEAAESWSLVAETDQGPADVVALIATIGKGGLEAKIADDIKLGTDRLRRIVGSADGLQKTRDTAGVNHHFANCMFNVMRGGIFQDGYAIDKADLASVIKRFNSEVFAKHQAWINGLPATLGLAELGAKVATVGDASLARIVGEYLPLSFSRRHGDPSRPWNIFSIDLKDAKGDRILAYQGNWRDIFQNWEALSLSFPDFADGFIAKFLNSTTADGYNPYRIGKFGFDWEKPSPHDPWAHIGYWGDHQLIYLLRLMEWSAKFHPGRLQDQLRRDSFVYADVPYTIKGYEDLVKDPKNTITYDKVREKAIQERTEKIGVDGQLVHNARGAIHTVNLAEKLLVPLLAKISNFIPGAGIWLNTQRPEWNDANNALAGYGLSMVTLYYARRYAAFAKEVLAGAPAGKIALSKEVATWLAQSVDAMMGFGKGVPARALVEPMGKAAATYHSDLYAKSLSGEKAEIDPGLVVRFLDLTLALADEAIAANRRADGLYHAYNVFNPESMEVRTLYEMLEGQVAVLSSGALSTSEAISVLQALRQSRMYRADQHSYILYPDKDLPRFTAKNNLPAEAKSSFALLKQLVADGNTDVVEADIHGTLHFNGDLKNTGDLNVALFKLKSAGYEDLVEKESTAIVALFDKVFDHQSFTGRSGTFFGYEGLGSIYWHMVSKLLLAAQENFFAAVDAGKTAEAQKLRDIYYDVRAGISFNKTPAVYGAFPSDPYSHTPANAGAKQPGMTGQVKEEVITRLGELGIRMEGGSIRIQPVLLRQSEFLEEASAFNFANAAGQSESLQLPAGSLAFTLCQVPVVYHLASAPNQGQVKLSYRDGRSAANQELSLSPETCRDIYGRTGNLKRIDVFVPRSILI